MLSEVEKQKITRIESLKFTINKQALTEIVSSLSDKSRAVRLSAVEALAGFCRFPTAKRALYDLLHDKNWDVRLGAIESLENFHGDDVLTSLVPMINDRNSVVRVGTIEAIQNIGGKREISSILPLLKDKNEIVRGYAAIALATLGDESVLPAIHEQLEREANAHAKVRMFFSLVWLGEKQHLDNILRILISTNSYRVRIVAINCLVDLADRNNVSIITESFRKLIRRDQPRSVMSTIAKAYKDIKDLLN
jgi:HEAT repeat protein